MAEESKLLSEIQALRDEIKKATPPDSVWTAMTRHIEGPPREKEPSLLGLESSAPPPVKWFSRFMIWTYPDKAARTEAVNVVVRRTMQVVSLLTAALTIYLTSVVSRLESRPAPVFTRDIQDAGADQ